MGKSGDHVAPYKREAVVRGSPVHHLGYEHGLPRGTVYFLISGLVVVAFTFYQGLNAAVSRVGDGVTVTFDLTVGAGETASVLQFATLIRDDADRSGDVGAALAMSDLLLGSPDLRGLGAAEIAGIANAASPVPLPGAMALMMAGLGVGGFARRRARS